MDDMTPPVDTTRGTIHLPSASLSLPRRLIIVVVACGAMLGWLAVDRPIGQDDTFNLMAARLLRLSVLPQDDGGGGTALLFHPPLYPWMISQVHAVLGERASTARVIGWLAHVLTAVLLTSLIGRLAEREPVREEAQVLGTAFFVLSPLALQGITVIDIDSAVLPLWITGWLLLLIRVGESASPLRLAAFALATGLGFSLKMTTPPVVVVMGLAALVAGRDRRTAFRVVCATGVALVLFLGAYQAWGAPRGLAISNIIRYAVERGGHPLATWLSVVSAPKTVVEIALWMSPWVLILATCAVVWGFARPDWRIRMLSSIATVLFLGYLIIGGTTFGYPKYHCPVLPILCALVGLWCAAALQSAARQHWRMMTALCAGLLLWHLVVVGDPLLTFRYEYRSLAAVSDPRASSILAHAVWSLLATVGAVIAVAIGVSWRVGSWRHGCGVALVLASAAASLAMDGVQAAGRYAATHYGERHGARAAELVASHVDTSSRVIATREILYLTNRLEKTHASGPLGNAIWNDPVRFRSELADARVSAVVYSVAANTLHQYRVVFANASVTGWLREHFERRDLGSYTIWLRRPARPVVAAPPRITSRSP
jgi:4-amino-4-deoxy-L-arabinose transferase-like glycosyltransferase